MNGFARMMYLRLHSYTSLALPLVLAILFMVGVKSLSSRVMRQQATVQMIQERGGVVFYDWAVDVKGMGKGSHLNIRRLARDYLGDDLVSNVSYLRLCHIPTSHSEWTRIQQLLQHGGVISIDNAQFTDSDVAHLAPIEQLRVLSIGNTNVTDAGLQQIAMLTSLDRLVLNDLDITDSGVEQLLHMRQLTTLCLNSTKTTDRSLSHISNLPRLSHLYLDGCKITDRGLEYLKGMTQLRDVSLTETEVTEAGIDQLLGLRDLERLTVRHLKINDERLKRLQVAMPNCSVEQKRPN